MKRSLLLGLVSALLISSGASAQTAANSGAQSQSSINFHNPSDITSRSTPSAIAPGLTSSAVQTCLGSVSGGGSGIGWGAALGLTVKDRDCNLRLYATLVAQLGSPDAAYEILCNNREVRVALAQTGRPCAVDRRQPAQTVQASNQTRVRGVSNVAAGRTFYFPNDPNTLYVSLGGGQYRRQ